MAQHCIHPVMAAITLGILLLCSSTHGTGVTLQLNSVEYQNHSIVYADDINTYYDSDSTALQCRTDNPDCCSNSTGGYWYLPSGLTVLTEYEYNYYNWYYNGYVYQSRGGSSQQWAAVYLHRTSSLVTEGLYRCEIPTSGTHGIIEVAYVGVYWQSSSYGTPTISAALQFTRDDEGINQPGDSPVFTLTCNSGGGPATTVTWKRDGTVVSEDSNHVMTSALVGQSGPDYTSTLTVTGREDGLYTCTVTNRRGSADRQYQVQAASRPTSFSASQVGTTTTIRISWYQSNSGATPTGSRIYVDRRYYSWSSWSYVNANVQSGYNEYLLESLTIGYSYRLRMRTRSHQLPSAITSLVDVTIVPGAPTITTISPSSTSVHVYWQQVDAANTYEISFERLTGSQQLLCTDYGHSGSYSIGSWYSPYTLTGLEEHSVYSISLVAVTSNGVRSSSTTRQVTTTSAAPGVPQNLRSIATSETSITVQWDPVLCIDRNSAYEITGYKLRRTGYSREEAIPRSGGEGGMYTITGLSPLTTYSIEVAAVSNSGTGPFASIIVQTPLRIYDPTTITATSVLISWEQESVHSYVILYERLTGSQQLLCTDYGHSYSYGIGSQSSSYTLTGLEEYSVYSISLVAVVSGVTSTPATTQVTTLKTAPSSTPQDLRNTSTDETSITVQWGAVICIDRNSEITGYVVRYGEASSDQREEAVIAGSGDEGGTSTITGLSPLTSYYIEVAAVSDSGTGPFASITVRTPLYAPDDPLAVEGGMASTTIRITWDWQSFLNIYRISFERVTGAQQVLCPDVSHTGLETVDGGSTEYTVRGLQEYSTYSITVTAVNAAGETSSTLTATTLQAAPSGTPQGLNTTDVYSRNVTVMWTEPVCIDQNSEISHYLLRYKGNEIRVPERDGGHQYSLVITGLSHSTKYYIEVAAVNVNGATGPFAITTVKTLSEATATSGNVEFIIGGTVFLVVLLAATALVLIGIVKMALLLRKLNDQIPNSKEQTEMDELQMSTNECAAYGVAPPLQNQLQTKQPESNVYEPVGSPTHTAP